MDQAGVYWILRRGGTAVAAIVIIFMKLPVLVACMIVLVIPVGTFIVLRQITTQKGIRVSLMETKADMDGTMVELLGGIETIRTFDSAREESGRILERSEQLRAKEMRHHQGDGILRLPEVCQRGAV